MPWVNPSTVLAGSVLNATKWNQDVVRNTEFLAQPPSCRVTKSTEQSITTSVWRAISWNTQVWDTDNMWSSTDPTKININTNGKYQFTLCIPWAVSTSGNRYSGFSIDQTTAGNAGGTIARVGSRGGAAVEHNVTDVVSLTSTQFVRAHVWQDSGVALNIDHTVGSQVASITARWISS